MDKAHVALGAQIGLGHLRLQQFRLGRLHRREHRRGARVGAIDADAKVNLVLTRVFIVELDQRKKRIGGLLLQGGKGHARPLPLHRPGASMFDGKRASLPQNTPGPRNVVPARFPSELRLRTATRSACG
jgi:hypothetical protein